MTEYEKRKLLEFVLRNISDQLNVDCKNIGFNDTSFREEWMEHFKTMIKKIEELQDEIASLERQNECLSNDLRNS